MEEAIARQDMYELDCSFEGGNLVKNFDNCKKNPGHEHFIPLENLKKNHLSPNHSHRLDLVKSLAQLTVKLKMAYVSPERPLNFPYSERRGQSYFYVGSGCVTDISESVEEITCPLENCREKPGTHPVYGYITITTAAHVVCDNSEAEKTTVEFFKDSKDGNNVKTGHVVKVATVSVDGDFCELVCVVHDKEVLKSVRLAQLGKYSTYEQMKNFWCYLFDAYQCLRRVKTISHDTLRFYLHLGGSMSTVVSCLTALMSPSCLAMFLDILRCCQDPSSMLFVVHVHGDIQLHFDNETVMLPVDGMAEKWTLLYKTSDTNLIAKKLELLLNEIPLNIFNLNEYLKSQPGHVSFKYFNVRQITESILELTARVNIDNSLIRSDRSGGTSPINERDVDNLFETNSLVVHISHPHGQPKMVSFGSVVNCSTGDGHYRQVYTVHTCPGGSGGPIWIIPNVGDRDLIYAVPHSRHQGNLLNQGSAWTMYLPMVYDD